MFSYATSKPEFCFQFADGRMNLIFFLTRHLLIKWAGLKAVIFVSDHTRALASESHSDVKRLIVCSGLRLRRCLGVCSLHLGCQSCSQCRGGSTRLIRTVVFLAEHFGAHAAAAGDPLLQAGPVGGSGDALRQRLARRHPGQRDTVSE